MLRRYREAIAAMALRLQTNPASSRLIRLQRCTWSHGATSALLAFGNWLDATLPAKQRVGPRSRLSIGLLSSMSSDLTAEMYMVTRGYFGALGIRQLAGRDFAGEAASGPKIAVVNRAFVEHVF